MSVSRSDQFWQHWRSLPRVGLIPTLTEFLSRPNPATQPWTTIIDLEPNALPIRLFGTGMASLMGHDYTGGDYLRAVRPEFRADMMERDTTCARFPCGLHHRVRGSTAQGREFTSEISIAPVSRPGGQFSLIRCSDIKPYIRDEDLPLTLTGLISADWVDLGAGVPDRPPWAETSAT